MTRSRERWVAVNVEVDTVRDKRREKSVGRFRSVDSNPRSLGCVRKKVGVFRTEDVYFQNEKTGNRKIAKFRHQELEPN